jgi:hypothetical protein
MKYIILFEIKEENELKEKKTKIFFSILVQLKILSKHKEHGDKPQLLLDMRLNWKDLKRN